MARQDQDNGNGDRMSGTGRKAYSAQDVRQSDIVLRTRGRRVIFIAGLIGAALLALIGLAVIYH